MAYIEGNTAEIRELARYEVRPESLESCLAAIHEFVAYVRANEAGALRYEVWQESELRRPSGCMGNQPPSRRLLAPSTPTVWHRLNSLSTSRSTLVRRCGNKIRIGAIGPQGFLDKGGQSLGGFLR